MTAIKQLNVSLKGEAYVHRRGTVHFGAGYPWGLKAIKEGKTKAAIFPDRLEFKEELSGDLFSLPIDRKGFLRDLRKRIVRIKGPSGAPVGLNMRDAALGKNKLPFYIPFFRILLGLVPEGLVGKTRITDPNRFAELASSHLSGNSPSDQFPYFFSAKMMGQKSDILYIPIGDKKVPIYSTAFPRMKGKPVAVSLESGYFDSRITVYTDAPAPKFLEGYFYDKDKRLPYELDPALDQYGVRTYFAVSDEEKRVLIGDGKYIHFSPKSRAGLPWFIDADKDGIPFFAMPPNKRTYGLPVKPNLGTDGKHLSYEAGITRATEALHAKGNGFEAKVHAHHESLAISIPGTKTEQFDLYIPKDCGISAGETIFVETKDGHPVRLHPSKGKPIQLMTVLDKQGAVIYSSARRVPKKYLAGSVKLVGIDSFLKKSKTGRSYEYLSIGEKGWMIRRVHDEGTFKPSTYEIEIENGRLLSAKSKERKYYPIVARGAVTGKIFASAPGKATNLKLKPVSILEQVPVKHEDGTWYAKIKGKKIPLPQTDLKDGTRLVTLLARSNEGDITVANIFPSARIYNEGSLWPAKYFEALLNIDPASACEYLLYVQSGKIKIENLNNRIFGTLVAMADKQRKQILSSASTISKRLARSFTDLQAAFKLAAITHKKPAAQRTNQEALSPEDDDQGLDVPGRGEADVTELLSRRGTLNGEW